MIGGKMAETIDADIWRKIVEVHNRGKFLLLLAEESDLDHRTFLQPGMEQRNALEHIVRAKAAELGLTASAPEKNLDKALGHEYRCFFDVADWLSMRLREKIIETFEPYSNKCIHTIMPDYYPEIRPAILRASKRTKGVTRKRR